MGWGDELMVTGRARVLQESDPQRRRVRVTHGVRSGWHESWENNPRIAHPSEEGSFLELPARIDNLRPYCKAKYDDRWVWQPHQAPVGELYFSAEEAYFGEKHAGLVIIEPHIKRGASPNKQWGEKRWAWLAELLIDAGLPLAQFVYGGMETLRGVRRIHTHSMRQAAAVMARARAAVLPEGGLHHVAAAVGCPAVVLFGGYISPEVSGYATQRSLFVKTDQHPLGCGLRWPCKHCGQAMASITPQQVAQELGVLLETSRRSLAA